MTEPTEQTEQQKESEQIRQRRANFDDSAIKDALVAVQLDGLLDRLDEAQPWAHQLSGGEQQRLAFARVLLQRPDWLFLDEATAALDAQAEAHLYGQLQRRLPGAAVVSIAHRPEVAEFHRRTVDLGRGAQEARRVCAAPALT